MSVREILAKLVSFPVLGGQSNTSIADWIERYLEGHGVAWHNVPNEDGTKRSIHCRIGPAVDGGIILSGHTDVVPTEGQAWRTDPFKLVEKDGRLYGRGTCDMKGFLACCLAAVPDFLAANLQRPIYLAFSYDEEIGCWAGPALARHMATTYDEKPLGAIIGEPSLLQVVNGQKGMGSFETTIRSRGAHSSYIYSEVSAVHEGAKLVNWLEQRMEQLVRNGQRNDRFQPNHTTLHAGMLHGGIAHNIVADRCKLRWDMRTLPSDNLDQLYAEFCAFCDERTAHGRRKVPEFAIKTVEKFPMVVPLDTDAAAPIVRLAQSLTDVAGLGTVSFASEAGQFAAAGFPAVICGPGSIEQAHGANEYIAAGQLERGMDWMKRLRSQLAARP